MRGPWPFGAAALLASCLAVSTHAADAPASPDTAGGMVTVSLADGTTVPLRGWTLQYEYSVYKQGTSPLAGTTQTRPAREIYLGKRVLPAPGLAVTIVHTRLGQGEATMDVVRTLKVTTPDGKTSEYKVEPPARELLAPALEKGQLVMARTMDLQGETLTGTRRDLCLVSFTTVVQCGTTAEDQVTKLEFQR